jgi:hypothetical protein
MSPSAIILIGAAATTWCCQRVTESNQPLDVQVRPPAVPSARSVDPLLAKVCGQNDSCTVVRRRFVAASQGVQIVDVRKDHVSGPSPDETCNRRQYWLIRPGMNHLLLAEDCETQPSADSLAPADTRLDGRDFVLTYTESESNDGCERLESRVRVVPTVRVLDERRWTGKQAPVTGICRIQEAEKELPTHGQGVVGDPLLKLHR